MSNDLISLHLKAVEASLKSQFAVFALTNSSEDLKSLSHSASSLAKTLEFMHDIFLETRTDTVEEALTNRIYKPNREEYDATYFKPHIMAGYSPFMLQMDGKKIAGALVKLQHKNVAYCQKSIKRLTQARFEKGLRDDEMLTMKACRLLVEADLKEGKLVLQVPLVDKYQDHYFYIDFKHQVVLAKNAHRSRDVINMFFSLLSKVGKVLQERHPEIHANLEVLLTDTFKERMDISPYSTYALTHQKAFGAYSIHDVVNHYSQEEAKDDVEAMPFTPTDTAGFTSDSEVDARIEFKNAVGYFLGHDKKTLPSYRTLSSFSDKHHLKAFSLRVAGEIDLPDQVKRYKEAHPENLSDEISGNHLSMVFDTRASDGNVTFKITSGLTWPVEAARRLLQDLFNDTHIGKKQVEPALLKEFGALLEVLHYSCSLFIEFYLRANQANEEMGETALERDLKQAQEEAAKPFTDEPATGEPSKGEEAA